MANPANPGTFDFTITDTIDFWVLPPKSGSTGDFDRTVTDTIDFDVYVEAEAAGNPWNVYAQQ